MAVELLHILTGVGSALLYSLLFYVKKREKETLEEFNKTKLAATLIVGIGVGLGYSISGSGVNELMIHEAIAANAGTVVLIESVLKTLFRKGKKAKGSKSS